MKRVICCIGILVAVLSAKATTNQPSLLWKYSLPENSHDLASGATPAVANDGTIYVASFYGRLNAVSPQGRKIWLFQAGREIESSPAIGDDGTIYFGCRDWKFYAVTPAGQLKWTFPTGAWVDSSPALGVDGTIYFGSWDGNFYAVNPDGSKKWAYNAGGIVDSSPAIGVDGTIYFGSHDRNFYALKPDGTLRWKFTTGDVIPSSPAIGADGTIYFTSMDHCIYALTPEGKQRWRRDIRNITRSSPVLDAAGHIHLFPCYFGCSLGSDGHRIAIYPSPTAEDTSLLVGPGEELFTTRPWRRFEAFAGSEEPVWFYDQLTGNLLASPVMSTNGVIYVLDVNFLYAFGADWGAALGHTGPWPMFHANARHTGRASNQ